MKKIIAAALSILVGACGYTIVDKAIEKRVEDLEKSMSSLVEENNSLHHLKEYSTERITYTAPTTAEPTTRTMPDAPTINPTTRSTTAETTK